MNKFINIEVLPTGYIVNVNNRRSRDYDDYNEQPQVAVQPPIRAVFKQIEELHQFLQHHAQITEAVG